MFTYSNSYESKFILNRGYMWNKNYFEIILKLFQYFISRVWNWDKISSAAEWVLKLFQKYFNDIEHVEKYMYSRAATVLWNNFEIILDKFARAEVKLF